MVVGSGQSGAQIAEDLLINGMDVSLALSKCGRRLRSYRGKDSSWWNYKMGLFDKTVDDVPLRIDGNAARILLVQMAGMKLI